MKKSVYGIKETLCLAHYPILHFPLTHQVGIIITVYRQPVVEYLVFLCLVVTGDVYPSVRRIDIDALRAQHQISIVPAVLRDDVAQMSQHHPVVCLQTEFLQFVL